MSAKALCFRVVRAPRFSSVDLCIRTDLVIPQYLMNCLSNLDETDSVYSLAHTDDLVKLWRSKVKVTAGRRGSEGFPVDAATSKSI